MRSALRKMRRKMITFKGLFTEDPDRKFGAENYFTAHVSQEHQSIRFQGDCRDYYGFSYLQGFRSIESLIFTKIYRDRSDVLLYVLKEFKAVEMWQFAGVWCYAKELDLSFLDGPYITDPNAAIASADRIAQVVGQYAPAGGSARLRMEKG